MSEPINREHHVNTTDGADYTVAAAYYIHEEDFTVFKSPSGAIVGSFHNRSLVSIVVGEVVKA